MGGAVLFVLALAQGLRTSMYICGCLRGSTLFPRSPIGGLRNCICFCTRPLGGCALCQHSPTEAVFLFRRSPMGLRMFTYVCGRLRGSTLLPRSPTGGLRNCIYFCTRPLGGCALLPTLAYWGCVLSLRSPMGLRHVGCLTVGY